MEALNGMTLLETLEDESRLNEEMNQLLLNNSNNTNLDEETKGAGDAYLPLIDE